MVFLVVLEYVFSLTAIVLRGSMLQVSRKVAVAIIGRTAHGVEAIIPKVYVRAPPLFTHHVIIGCMKATWRMTNSLTILEYHAMVR